MSRFYLDRCGAAMFGTYESEIKRSGGETTAESLTSGGNIAFSVHSVELEQAPG